MYDSGENDKKQREAEEDMVRQREKANRKVSKKISRQELRKNFIRESILKNRVALEKLSRT